MDKTQIKKYTLNILIYAIAYYYILLSSINDGFSGFTLGLPYAVFLLLEITDIEHKRIIKYLHTFVLISAFIFIIIDKSNLKIIYPAVGEKITIVNDINYSYSKYSINSIHFYPEYSEKPTKIFLLKKGDTITIKRQIQKGHNVIISNGYRYEISSNAFEEMRKYIKQNFTQIKDSAIQNTPEKYVNEKVKSVNLYVENPNMFYTSDLFELLRSQKLSMNRYPRYNNLFIYLSFYIFVYPVIFALFIMLTYIREKSYKS